MKIQLLFLALFLALNAFSQDNIQVQNLRSWLFINIDNPMFINYDEIPLNEIIIKAPSCKISTLKQDGYFSLTPLRRGHIDLKVYRKINQDSMLLWEGIFSAKYLPQPSAFIIRGRNSMSKQTFLAQRGIYTALVNYGISIGFPVARYTIIITKGEKLLLLKDMLGGEFSPEFRKKLKDLLTGGERIFFTNIEIKSRYHDTKTVNSIEIKIVDNSSP